MIRRTLLILTVVAVLVAMMLTTVLPAVAAPIDPTGAPEDPDCWGEVTSQVASPRFGQHASDPIPGDDDRETPREGVGNVSRTDSNEPGDHPSDHGEAVGPAFGAFCEEGVGGGAGK